MANLIPERFLFRYSIPVQKLKSVPDLKSGLFPLTDKYQFPSFAELEREEDYAKLAVGWHPKGLLFEVQVDKESPVVKFNSDEPEVSDGIWFWIDTRNTQNIHRASRFCQSFFCYPNQPKQTPGNLPVMIARAREEAVLPEPSAQQVQVEHTDQGYHLQFWIPAESLTDYDPENFSELGFYYCVQDFQRGEQTLSVGREFPIAHDPSLWATLVLVG
ncbi:hypothetical protein Pla110_25590 [Polystyrenella longa]|uniref:Carbohydrate-binding domain-containing protein n=1 Tax=Polystyrenella longa TaxID=2528007 RepID=A0A518CNQ8_9PLAN|nr:hypothetical protein [Polystyrenella longa]QDU80824.1 hypothetical protein Pla110_25590 [Polystyrenella longa]